MPNFSIWSRRIENRLPLPPLLIELMQTGRWQQPTDAKIQSVIPFLIEPVNFLMSAEMMRFESQGILPEDPKLSTLFHEYRGSKGLERGLPWIDTDKSLFIAVNREPGADLGIALDYRTNMKDPRVVASDWWTEENNKCIWRQVEERFSHFVERLEL